MSVTPPWEQTYYSFSGPGVAISCEVEWDSEREAYVATSDTGYFGLSIHGAKDAALMCFTAWVAGRSAGYQSSEEATA